MPEDLTTLRVQLVMLAIELRRLEGEFGDTEPVPPRRMAEIASELGVPFSESAFYRIIHRAIRKIRHSHHIIPPLSHEHTHHSH